MRGCACRGTAGFAHVSCLVEQAKILFAEGEENNLGLEALDERWKRWHKCGLCEQAYHGVVYCALGWACWKTYLGRPVMSQAQSLAMRQLGYSLYISRQFEDALSVQEAELAMLRRLGVPEDTLLDVQSSLACTYGELGQLEESLSIERDVYSGWVRLNGEEHRSTLLAAHNYAVTLKGLKRFEEAKSVLRKMMPVARRVLGENDETTLKMRWIYGQSLYWDTGATLDDLREAVTIIEDTERIARRVFGGAHPLTTGIEDELQNARAALGGSSKGSN